MSGEQKQKWTKKGYEVHVSKDGTDGSWYRGLAASKRPHFEENELRQARVAFDKATKENKFTRLIKLEMNYELVDFVKTGETEQEKKDKLLAAAKALFKDEPAVGCSECSSMGFGTDGEVHISPSRVQIEIKAEKLECGPQPRRAQFKGDNAKSEFAFANSEWAVQARPLHEAKAKMVASKLKEAGIPFQTGQYNGFKSFRLA